MQEGRVGVLQVAHDRLAVGCLGVIEEEQVVAPVVLRAVHRVSDVLGGEKATVLELARLEVHIVANGERVRFAVFGDFPLGGDAGQIFALIDVLLHERVAVVLADLIGGGGVDVKRVEVAAAVAVTPTNCRLLRVLFSFSMTFVPFLPNMPFPFLTCPKAPLRQGSRARLLACALHPSRLGSARVPFRT